MVKILFILIQLIILIANMNYNQELHFHRVLINNYYLILYQFLINLNLMNLIKITGYQRPLVFNHSLNQ